MASGSLTQASKQDYASSMTEHSTALLGHGSIPATTWRELRPLPGPGVDLKETAVLTWSIHTTIDIDMVAWGGGTGTSVKTCRRVLSTGFGCLPCLMVSIEHLQWHGQDGRDDRALQWTLTNPNSLGPVPIQISESFGLVMHTLSMGHCGIWPQNSHEYH